MKHFTFLPVMALACLAGCASFYTGGAIENAGARLVRTPLSQSSTEALSAAGIAELAVGNSLELQADKNAMDARIGAWKLGFRAYLPRVEASAGSDERLSVYGDDSFTKNLSVSLTQPLWDGGRLVTARSLEAYGISLARAELERKARAIGEAAIEASRAVLAASARLEIKHSARASASIQKSLLVTEIALGLAMDADLLEIETSLASMDMDLAEAELALATARAELAEALCVDLLPELSERLLRDKPALRLDPGIVGAAAVERSPELALARYSLVKKQAEYKASKYSWIPTIGLKISGFVSGQNFPLTRATWSAGATIDFSGPYLSGSGSVQLGGEPPSSYTARTNNRLEFFPEPAQALSSRQAALALGLDGALYSAGLAKVERSAGAALVVYENAVRMRDIRTRALGLAESKLRLIEVRLGLGQAVRSDLLKAQLERATGEVDLVDAVAALEAAERGLERLIDIPPGTLQSFYASMKGVLQ